jgi:UDP-N-acetylglucosamine:LPS N-acetylglucosamine transferase
VADTFVSPQTCSFPPNLPGGRVSHAQSDVTLQLGSAARTPVPSGADHIMLVGSSGGHLAQLYALRPWWTDRKRSWVTFPTPDAISLLDGEDVIYAHYPTTRNVRNLARNAVLARRLLRRLRPDVVVSTGAGVAVPFFAVAHRMGIPTVYIEVYDRIETRTLTARLCRPFTSKMLVQWDEQLELYPDSEMVGPLL